MFIDRLIIIPIDCLWSILRLASCEAFLFFPSAIPKLNSKETVYVLSSPTGPRVLVSFHLRRWPSMPHSAPVRSSAVLLFSCPQTRATPCRANHRSRHFLFLL